MQQRNNIMPVSGRAMLTRGLRRLFTVYGSGSRGHHGCITHGIEDCTTLRLGPLKAGAVVLIPTGGGDSVTQQKRFHRALILTTVVTAIRQWRVEDDGPVQ